MPEDKFQLRTITVRGTTYARVEDIADLIEEFGVTEETDVRVRAETLAANVRRLNQVELPE